MNIIPMLLKEMEQEAQTTRKMLARIPNDKYNWRPHEKSMTISRLANHIVELPGWITMTLTTDELDFANNPYIQRTTETTTDLLIDFERSYEDGKAHLEKATEDQLQQNWTLRNGDQIYNVATKAEILRMAFCQTVHHRAQLGVFLRLLNVPIPGSYGPSADEINFN